MKAFYVSVIDGSKSGLIVGPFNTHAEALEMVEPVRRKANEISPRSYFYAFGTASIELEPGESAPAGTLNKYFDTIEKRHEAIHA